MLLCQISDPHIVPYGTLAYGRIDTPRFLERCVAKVLALPRLPDAVVATGDLTDHATAEEYGVLREVLAPLVARMPVYLAVGNHDDRDRLRAAFPEFGYLAGEDGFVQYAIDDYPVRLVVLDTLIPGAPGGELCPARLQWLDRTLAQSDRPTIVAQHHPPLETGITIMKVEACFLNAGSVVASISEIGTVEVPDWLQQPLPPPLPSSPPPVKLRFNDVPSVGVLKMTVKLVAVPGSSDKRSQCTELPVPLQESPDFVGMKPSYVAVVVPLVIAAPSRNTRFSLLEPPLLITTVKAEKVSS